MRRLREFDVRPNRELGQNFLVDDNILDVIGRAAELEAPVAPPPPVALGPTSAAGDADASAGQGTRVVASAAGDADGSAGQGTRVVASAAGDVDASAGPGTRGAAAAASAAGDALAGPATQAALGAPAGADVVLEVGGGLGVLSEYLASRVAHLHVVEIDRTLAPPLEDALAPFDNATLHFDDAVKLDFGALRPAPTKVVANLPYGVAATVLLRSIVDLPGATLWVAMVQREVGQRLAAKPGGRVYGATSVLAQLACDVRVLRRVPRTVFHPEPNVESALIVMRRHSAAPPAEVSALVHGAFAHRRKALAGSLTLVPGAPQDIRTATRAALERIGHPPDARAERLAPPDWPRLADAIGHDRLRELRPR